MPVQRLGPSELLILRSVQQLNPQLAYSASIQRYLKALGGRVPSLGQISTTLERLEAKELVTSQRTAPEPIRGGRAKRAFVVEERGVQALEQAAVEYAMIFAEEPGVDHEKTEPNRCR